MGEYAKRKSDGVETKIGTCESMYYLRYEDRNKVEKIPHSLDATKEENLYWRLPFPDEDKTKIGEYNDHDRGQILYDKDEKDFTSAELAQKPGIIQLRDEKSGLLLNVPCYHGELLPEIVNGQSFWNGKKPAWVLSSIKNSSTKGIIPVIRCRFCNKAWSTDWLDIWNYISPDMQARLQAYKDAQAINEAMATV